MQEFHVECHTLSAFVAQICIYGIKQRSINRKTTFNMATHDAITIFRIKPTGENKTLLKLTVHLHFKLSNTTMLTEIINDVTI